MLAAILAIGGIGFVGGLGLAIASKIFYVYVDPKVEAIEDELPGANCGGCGYPGCSSAAEAIASGDVPANICVGGGPDVHIKVAAIMGVEIKEVEPEIALPGCRYGVEEADIKYIYDGFNDCRAAMLLYGGSKECPIGCLGLGTCVNACPFDALSIGPDNLPVVNKNLCTGCGTCERVCPKGIISITSATRRIIDEYITDECTAPCQRACPTGIDIPGFIHEISNGNYEGALLTIKEKCPLPLICGYICPAPCELACRRNLADEAVAINPLKRFVADYEMATGKHINPYKCTDNGIKIAIIGGGSEGLTAGYYLSRLGYQATIFEAKPELGGILRYVIAEDRLPRNVLDHDIKGILEMGVEAKTNVLMGRDFTANTLFQDGFDAILMTTGGYDSRKILHSEQKNSSSAIQGVFLMLDFITRLDRGEETQPGRHVVIVHNGLKALDLARKCRELGSDRVTIVSDQPLDLLPAEFNDDSKLQAEGIEIRPSTVVTAMEGVSERLSGIILEDADPSNDATSEKEVIGVDTLIISAARIPEVVFVHADGKPESLTDEVSWRTIETYLTFPARNNKGMFTPPEPGRISDSSAVVKSLLSGRRLTRAIHQHFTDGLISPIDNLISDPDLILNITEVHDVNTSERQRPAVLDVEGDSKTAWIFPKEFPGLDEQAVRQEADRCLQCGLICYKKT